MTNPFGLAPAADVDHQRRADRRPSSTGCGSLVRWAGGVVLCALLAGGLAERGAAQERSSAVADRRDDLSPWGVASGAEWFNAYPQFMPVLRRAGVGWLRGFYEWQIIQPVPGRWNFTLPDALVRTARANDVHLVGVLAYLAPWASADGGTRQFPIKDIRFWRDYVDGLVTRYHADIKYWEIWNEFNGSFAPGGTPAQYAELVREAAIAAKKIDPNAKIGMSVASFDVNFIDAAIKSGAAGHFDFVCVHPYEYLAELAAGGEPAFLSMTTSLRNMLKANHQSERLPLWITEIGSSAPTRPDQAADDTQAVLLTKAYLLSIAAGFERVFWFEARGPSYGKGTDYGLIREDMSPRPSLTSLKTLTDVLGQEPKAAGWLNLGDGIYGFLFDGAKGAVLAAWTAPRHDTRITFDSEVLITAPSGASTTVGAGTPVSISSKPVLLTGLSPRLIEMARKNRDAPYPWAASAAGNVAVARLGDDSQAGALSQIRQDTTVAEQGARRMNFARADKEGHYAYFRVDPAFLGLGAKQVEITAVVRRAKPGEIAGMSVDYESTRGYVGADYRTIPDGDQWTELSWRLSDANFAGAWGWNFRLNAIASPNELLIREVRVKKLD